MSRNLLRHFLSIVLLPVMVTVVIPAFLVWQTGPLSLAWGLSFPWNFFLMLAGLSFLLAGLTLVVQTITLFIQVGEGTIAPWDPTQKLVVRGPYRYVRNPMISGVLSLLLAEAILLGSAALLTYFLIAAAVNMVYIPLSEEPGLLRRFGKEYALYRQHVPRWIPRLKPWDGQAGDKK